MKKIILLYGLISGSVIIGIMIFSIMSMNPGDSMAGGVWLGYLIMIVALSLIFFGVKSYRDNHLGGVIKFGKAFTVGLGIALVASLVYVLVWEIYIQTAGGDFINQYASSYLEQLKDSGVTGQELSDAKLEMEGMVEMYGNPLFRFGMTFLEIFPVGLIISLISAALLRKSEFLPAAESTA